MRGNGQEEMKAIEKIKSSRSKNFVENGNFFSGLIDFINVGYHLFFKSQTSHR